MNGSNANTFTSTNSNYPASVIINGQTQSGTMSNILSQYSQYIAALVVWDSPNMLFLGPSFWDPQYFASAQDGQAVQSFILMHEVVHLVGNIDDSAFNTNNQNNGSHNLTNAIINACVPVLGAAGELGSLYY